MQRTTRERTVASRIALIVVSTLAVATVLVTIISTIRVLDQVLNNSLPEEGEHLLATLSSAMEDPLLRTDVNRIQNIAETIVQDEEIIFVRVYDEAGRLVADSGDEARRFSPQPDPAGVSLLSALTPVHDLANDEFTSGQAVSAGNQVIGAISIGISTSNSIRSLISIGLQGLFTSLLLAFSGGVIIYFYTKVALGPLSILASATEKIAMGELDIRVPVETADELGTLSNAFNLMAEQIHLTRDNLDHRVQERTAELESNTLVMERRAHQLKAIADISQAISSFQELDILLPYVTKLISEQLGFYHVGIFLLDEKSEYAVLKAANSEGGKAMLARGHRLRVGSQGIVGTVTQLGLARIALDVGNDAVFFNNPDLPTTRSEIALPLSIGKSLIGALDVQSEIANAFSEEDIDVLGTLASQVAITIQNTQLISTTQKALQEVQNTIRQYVRQQWSSQQFREQIVGKVYENNEVQPIVSEIRTPEAERALTIGKIEKTAGAVAIPIKLRGETIGLLGVQASGEGREWNEDEIVMMQSAAERVAISIENARLLTSSQKQAAKERVIGTISARISAAVDIEDIMETAAQELGQAISGSEVIVQFKGKA